MLDSPSKGFRPRPVNGPKYVTYVALCGVRVAEQPRRASILRFTIALLFTGRAQPETLPRPVYSSSERRGWLHPTYTDIMRAG
jgi:hypothetical protein